MKHLCKCAFLAAVSIGSLNYTTAPAVSQNIQESTSSGLTFDSGADPKNYAMNYLKVMKLLIQRYNSTVMNSVLGASGVNMDPQAMMQASAQTQQLARDIKAVKPPQDVAPQHAQLANSLGSVQGFLQGGGSATEGMGKAMQLGAQIQSTFSNYHMAVNAMMEKNGIDQSLSPFAGESESDKQRALSGIEQLKNQASMFQMMGGGANGALGGSSGTGIGGPAFGGGGTGIGGPAFGRGGTGIGGPAFGSSGMGGASGLGSGGGGLGSLLQGLGGGGTGSGGSGLEGLMNGMDPNAINNALGGEASGGTGSGAPSVNSLLKQLGQGALGGSGGGDSGSTPSIDSLLNGQ